MIPMTSVRPAQASDETFLFSVFASTRADITHSNLPDAQKEQFLRMQFRAQHEDYTTNYPDANFLIVLADNVPAGRLYVHHRPDEIRIIDISLLPQYRNLGIGARLISNLFDEARRVQKPVRIHVEKYNQKISINNICVF